MKNPTYEFLYEENGATAVEYSIMAAAIALAVIIIVFALGTNVADLFNNFNTEYDTVAGQ